MPPLGTRFTLTSSPRLPPTLVHWLPRYWYQAERPMASANAPWRKAEYTRNFLRVTSSVLARATLIFFLWRSFIGFRTIGDGFGDDADVVDAGDAEGIDDGG